MRLTWLLLLLLGCCNIVDAVGADIRYVDAESLNVRDAPGGRVVGTLPRSAAVLVTASNGQWVQIEDDRYTGRWVSGEQLCRGAKCWHSGAFQSSGHSSSGPSYPATQSLAPSSYRSTQQVRSSGSCPCSGSFNCTGPRGGQYCITSGGNKRYR